MTPDFGAGRYLPDVSLYEELGYELVNIIVSWSFTGSISE